MVARETSLRTRRVKNRSLRPASRLLNHYPGAARNLSGLRRFVAELQSVSGLRCRWFEVTLVGDEQIERLNRRFRRKKGTTDVLSFPWSGADGAPAIPEELRDFLGDIIISVDTARRNASQAGNALPIELRQLILHGLLHLLGYDHEADHGEMAALERVWRRRLGIATPSR
jgi:probable rRNA maturation factor